MVVLIISFHYIKVRMIINIPKSLYHAPLNISLLKFTVAVHLKHLTPLGECLFMWNAKILIYILDIHNYIIID